MHEKLFLIEWLVIFIERLILIEEYYFREEFIEFIYREGGRKIGFL
jgi:hypothetical protein